MKKEHLKLGLKSEFFYDYLSPLYRKTIFLVEPLQTQRGLGIKNTRFFCFRGKKSTYSIESLGTDDKNYLTKIADYKRFYIFFAALRFFFKFERGRCNPKTKYHIN